MGDGFYRSKDTTNNIKVLKEIYKGKHKQRKKTKYTQKYKIVDAKKIRI